MGLTESIVVGIVAMVLATELLEWLPALALLVLLFAVSRLPIDLRDRYREQWTADLEQVPGRISKFLWSIDLVRASFVISCDRRRQGSEKAFRSWLSRPYVIKAVQDALLAGTGLVLMAPLLLLIALAIKLDSRGPVLSRQARYGLHGEVFSLLKFRTLYAAQCDPPMEAFKQVTCADPRMTRIGRFLRRTSLDELPQLLNVLQGRMSVVGPRPHPVTLADKFALVVENYEMRHQIKPGITGWAYVNNLCDEIATLEALEQRVQDDIYYIRNWSFWLDMSIMLRTLLISLDSDWIKWLCRYNGRTDQKGHNRGRFNLRVHDDQGDPPQQS